MPQQAPKAKEEDIARIFSGAKKLSILDKITLGRMLIRPARNPEDTPIFDKIVVDIELENDAKLIALLAMFEQTPLTASANHRDSEEKGGEPKQKENKSEEKARRMEPAARPERRPEQNTKRNRERSRSRDVR